MHAPIYYVQVQGEKTVSILISVFSALTLPVFLFSFSTSTLKLGVDDFVL